MRISFPQRRRGAKGGAALSLLVAAVLACAAPAPTLTPTPPPVAPDGSPSPFPIGPPASPGIATLQPPASASHAAGGTSAPGGSPPPGETPTPADTPATGDGPWLYLADFPGGRALEVSSVTAHGDGFVAVGWEPFPDEGFGGRRNGVVWASADGLAWERSTPASLASATLLEVASLGGELFVFGRYSLCPEFNENDCQDAADAGVALWRSPEGADWQRLPVPSSLQAGILDGVAVGESVLAAYGGAGDDLLSVLWLSPDGEQWSELHETAAVDPISAVAVSPDRLAAFGTRYVPEEDDVETLAGYSEGGAFAQAQLPPGQRGLVQDVIWSAGRFLAVGLEYGDTGLAEGSIALVSDDGASWTAAPPDSVPADAAFAALMGLPSGYLAVGSRPDAGAADGETPHSWFSADGLTWTDFGALMGGGYRRLSSVGFSPAGAVVFVSDFEESDELEPLDGEAGGVHAWLLPSAAFP